MDLTVDCVASVDVGYKKTGVAITSNNGMWIIPLAGFELSRFNGNKWFESLRKILKPHWYQIKVVVVGNPISGEKDVINKISPFIDQVIRILKARTPFIITSFNERYSSQWAQDILRRINYSSSYIEKHVHSIAAAKILKDYLFDRLIVDYEINMIS